MTNYPRLHRTLVSLGAVQSLLTGLVLIVAPSLALALFLTPDSTTALASMSAPTDSIIELLLSFVGSLLIFYAFVMGAVAIRFDRTSIRIKGYGELLSGGLFLWMAISYREHLVLTMTLLAIQHIAVGIIYWATTTEQPNSSKREAGNQS